MDPLQESVSEVLRATGRQSPELGGGAASILAALIGVSLVRMAAATTHERGEQDMAGALKRLDGISERLEELARADVEVFSRYVDALRLPRDTQRQEAARSSALDETGHEAAETPLVASIMIVEGIEVAAEIAAHAFPEVSSDVYAGAAILSGAFFGALATLEINLRPRRMADRRDEFLRRKQEALDQHSAAMGIVRRHAEEAGYHLS
jgi:formiminotetrahydrofolate cyclodeaminase